MTTAALPIDFHDRVGVRWGILAAVLVGEGLALTISFESPAAAANQPWWVLFATAAPQILRVGIASIACLFVLLSPRLKSVVQEARAQAAHHQWQYWALLHLVVFGAIYAFLSLATHRPSGTGGQVSSAGLASCEGLAAAAVALWLLACAPLSYWRSFVIREWPSLLIAVLAASAAWFAGEIAQAYWKPLASVTFALAECVLRLFYSTVISDSSRLLVGTPRFAVHIAPQCSGYEGIGLITVFLGLYLWLFRSRIRLPHALVLFPIGVVAVGLANVARVVALVAIGSSYSRELAVGGFHSQAGWISFTALALAIVAVTHRMRFFAIAPASCRSADINPVVSALLAPFLVLLGSAMLISALAHTPERLDPLRIAIIVAALLCYRRIYARLDWSWSWPSLAIGTAVFLFWIGLEPIVTGARTPLGQTIAAMGPGEAIVWFGFRLLGTAIVIPVVEELAFRGYLLRRLATPDFESPAAARFLWVPFILSSLAFGLLHGSGAIGFVSGLAYAVAFYRKGKLGDAVIAHMTTNALIAVVVVATGAYSLWS